MHLNIVNLHAHGRQKGRVNASEMTRRQGLNRARHKNARLAADRRPGVGDETASASARAGGKAEVNAETIAVARVQIIVRPLVTAAETHNLVEVITDIALESVLGNADARGIPAEGLPDAAGHRRRETLADALLQRQIKTAEGMLAALAEAGLGVREGKVEVAGEARLHELIVQTDAGAAVTVASAVKEERAADNTARAGAGAMHNADRPVQAVVADAVKVVAAPGDEAGLEEGGASAGVAERDDERKLAGEVVVFCPEERRVHAETLAEIFLSRGLETARGKTENARRRFAAHITAQFVGLAAGCRAGRDAVLGADALGVVFAERVGRRQEGVVLGDGDGAEQHERGRERGGGAEQRGGTRASGHFRGLRVRRVLVLREAGDLPPLPRDLREKHPCLLPWPFGLLMLWF